MTDNSAGLLNQDLPEKTLRAQLRDLEKQLERLPSYKQLDRFATEFRIKKLKEQIRREDEAAERIDEQLGAVRKELADTPESRPALKALRQRRIQQLENESRIMDGFPPVPLPSDDGIAMRALQELKAERETAQMRLPDPPTDLGHAQPTTELTSEDAADSDRAESFSHAIVRKLKSGGAIALGFLILCGLFAVVGGLLGAAEALSEYVLPWCIRACAVALLVLVLAVLPASIAKRCRRFTAPLILFSSYLFGATLWMEGLLLTETLWGGWAVILGLCFLGVGVVPIAFLATLFHGMWSLVAELLVLLVLTFGCRFFAVWLDQTLGPR